MKALIIEDEYPAAERLLRLIARVDPSIQILDVLDSIEAAGKWFDANHPPDLIFSDIQLSDGLSFEIFRQNLVKSPVIFTTSYDEYAIRAFKVKSIDYLLKPIKLEELHGAIAKFREYQDERKQADRQLNLESFLDTMQSSTTTLVNTESGSKKYKKRFLVKSGEQLIPVAEEEIAYFLTSKELVLLVKTDGRQHLVDYTLEQLEKLLNPERFFRINRQFIAQLQAIYRIHTYFNGKLKLQLKPETHEEVLVSRDKAPEFKKWLEGQDD